MGRRTTGPARKVHGQPQTSQANLNDGAGASGAACVLFTSAKEQSHGSVHRMVLPAIEAGRTLVRETGRPAAARKNGTGLPAERPVPSLLRRRPSHHGQAGVLICGPAGFAVRWGFSEPRRPLAARPWLRNLGVVVRLHPGAPFGSTAIHESHLRPGSSS